MKSDFSRFLHHTLSLSSIRKVFTSSLSRSDLIGESRSNKFAALSYLDYRVKPDNDYIVNAGRSMVEMLGVLAIIGVLSVGAIAGCSKAMMKYKLNKHAEQMNTVINAVARNVHSFDNLSANGTSNVLTPIFIKMGEIPQEMIKANTNDYIYDIFGQRWSIFIGSDASNMFLTSWLENGSSFLSSSSPDSLAICQNILTAAKENSDSIFAITTTTSNSDSSLAGDEAISYRLYGDRYCSADKKCLNDLTLDDIYTVCTKHIKNSKAAFQLMWSRR